MRADSLTLRLVDPAGDAEVIHGWVTDPKGRYWMMGDHSVEQVREAYAEIDASEHHHAYLGLADGAPAFLVERYAPEHEPVGEVYDVQRGDSGMHFLCAPTDRPVSGFTRAVIERVMELLFADPAVARVVVEPDVGNEAVHRLNALVGFVPAQRVRLPGDKEALLSFCTREDWERRARDAGGARLAAHLRPELWAQATRALVAKALGEFAHERLFEPRSMGDGRFEVSSDDGTVTYRFAARRGALDHWDVDASSVQRTRDGEPLELDALALALELRESLSLGGERLGFYLEELSSTLAAAAFRLSLPPMSAAELAVADHQTIEARMSEGHPCFVANSGRLGFGADDYLSYAPEAGRDVRLAWVACHRDHTVFSCGEGLDYETLLRDELGDATLARFHERLDRPEEYRLLPVHPWQWANRLAVTFAADVALGRLVYLGYADDAYRAQQSIRTFYDVTTPERHYTKTALSVINMGFVRGLSAAYMEATPAINDWMWDLVEGDRELAASGFSILRERAAGGYRSEHYETASDTRSPYPKMLASLWRESPAGRVGDGERLATMASLLHVDADGRSLVGALIERSGLAASEWIGRYLDAYLAPLLHCYATYELVFMPHGENLILVLAGHAPARVIMKDIAEEIVVMSPDLELPDGVERIRAEVPEELRPLSIFTDVFDCFFRFLGAILAREDLLDEDEFWELVADRVERSDCGDEFFAERFELSCLNRLQLADHRQMVDLADPAGSLQMAGELENPLARYAARVK